MEKTQFDNLKERQEILQALETLSPDSEISLRGKEVVAENATNSFPFKFSLINKKFFI